MRMDPHREPEPSTRARLPGTSLFSFFRRCSASWAVVPDSQRSYVPFAKHEPSAHARHGRRGNALLGVFHRVLRPRTRIGLSRRRRGLGELKGIQSSMDGSRTFRKVAILCVAARCAACAMFLVWHFISAEVVGQTSTAQLGTVLALVLLPGCAWGAWRMDRSWAARASAYGLTSSRSAAPDTPIDLGAEPSSGMSTVAGPASGAELACDRSILDPVSLSTPGPDGTCREAPAKAAPCPGRNSEAGSTRTPARASRLPQTVRGTVSAGSLVTPSVVQPAPTGPQSVPPQAPASEAPRATHPPHRRRIARR